MVRVQENTLFVLCINNRDCDDLEKGKVYALVSDPAAEQDGYYRVVDESGEDYLYPISYFVPLELPTEAKAALRSDS